MTYGAIPFPTAQPFVVTMLAPIRSIHSRVTKLGSRIGSNYHASLLYTRHRTILREIAGGGARTEDIASAGLRIPPP